LTYPKKFEATNGIDQYMQTRPSMKTNRLFQPPSALAAALGLAVLLPASLHAVSVKYTSSGTFTPPAGITNIPVECWGGGGAGGSAWKTNGATGNAGGGGGGGGAYAK
jgi:hypothetical protein